MIKSIITLLFLSFGIGQTVFAQKIDKEQLLEFYQNQQYKEAAAYLKSAYPNAITDAKVLAQISYCYMMAGNLVEAEKTYLQLNVVQPNQIPVLFSLTNINAKRGNSKNAISYLQHIVALDSNNFNALKQLANLTDSLSKKIIYLKKANEVNAYEADIAYELALAHTKRDEHQQAYNVLNTAITADTSNLILQEALLPVANQLGKYKEVVTTGKKLLDESRDATVMRHVAKAYFFVKSYQNAIDLYQQLEKMDMQNEGSLYYTSLCYLALKNYGMASIYTKRTISEGISPNTAAYYNLLAGVYENQKQYSMAASAYQKGLTYGVNKNTYYRLGLLYDIKQKQQKTAVKYYRLYLNSKDLDAADQPQIDYVKSKIASYKN